MIFNPKYIDRLLCTGNFCLTVFFSTVFLFNYFVQNEMLFKYWASMIYDSYELMFNITIKLSNRFNDYLSTKNGDTLLLFLTTYILLIF